MENFKIFWVLIAHLERTWLITLIKSDRFLSLLRPAIFSFRRNVLSWRVRQSYSRSNSQSVNAEQSRKVTTSVCCTCVLLILERIRKITNHHIENRQGNPITVSKVCNIHKSATLVVKVWHLDGICLNKCKIDINTHTRHGFSRLFGADVLWRHRWVYLTLQDWTGFSWRKIWLLLLTQSGGNCEIRPPNGTWKVAVTRHWMICLVISFLGWFYYTHCNALGFELNQAGTVTFCFQTACEVALLHFWTVPASAHGAPNRMAQWGRGPSWTRN